MREYASSPSASWARIDRFNFGNVIFCNCVTTAGIRGNIWLLHSPFELHFMTLESVQHAYGFWEKDPVCVIWNTSNFYLHTHATYENLLKKL